MKGDKSLSESGNYRSRLHALLVYPDDPKSGEILENLKSFEHLIILHDRDKDKDGKPKKPHYHVVIRYKNATWRSAVSKELSIPVNYIQQVRNEEAMLCYLIHFREENKFQYSLDDVTGSLSFHARLKKLVENDQTTESDKVGELICFIQNWEGNMRVIDLSLYCAQNGRWDIFRRSGSIFLEILREKNKGLL